MFTGLTESKLAYESSLEELESHGSEFEDIMTSVSARLPASLSERLLEHLAERKSRARGEFVAGEHAVSIFADLLGTGGNSTRLVSEPWLVFYEHALLVDDLLDNECPSRPHDLILSHILLDVAHQAIARLVGCNQTVAFLYDRYRFQSWCAMLDELDTPQSGCIKREDELVHQQGQKSAMAKFCAALLQYVENGKRLSAEQERGIDCLCSGIQLLDDVADLEADCLHGRRNFVLCHAKQWISSRHDLEISAEVCTGPLPIFICSVLSNGISRAWTRAAFEFEQTFIWLDARRDSKTAQWLCSLITQCRSNSSKLSDLARRAGEQRDLVRKALLVNDPGLSGKPQELSPLWYEISRVVERGPRACN